MQTVKDLGIFANALVEIIVLYVPNVLDFHGFICEYLRLTLGKGVDYRNNIFLQGWEGGINWIEFSVTLLI